jgi:hypothetical protein
MLEGTSVGLMDGIDDGLFVDVGVFDGNREGFAIGTSVGVLEGRETGISDGIAVGTKLGC